MRTGDLFLKAKQKVEENLTNSSIALDKGRFVYLFNEAQNRYASFILGRKTDEAIRAIQRLVVFGKRLKRTRKISNPSGFLFELPDDFFAFSNVTGIVSKGSCSVKDFVFFEAKNENVHVLLSDEFNKPSFDGRETFYTVGDNGILVFTDEFSVDSLFLTYYRYPIQVNLAGHYTPSGQPSVDVDPEWDDKVCDFIVSMIAKQFNLNEGDLQKYQFDFQNLMSRI